MNVCVVGLWHLGCVTAACLASGGHKVVGLDFDAGTIDGLRHAQQPIHEPGLAELIERGLASGQLSFTRDVEAALQDAHVVWITYDTPIDDNDNADVESVFAQIVALFPHLSARTLVLISTQLPVGTTRQLERAYRHCKKAEEASRVTFAYSPENLRLGKAISSFTQPDRVVVGIRAEADRARILALFKPFTERIEWMSVESAEMTKHALNAFLATSIAFINEVAVICERVGADAMEVERGLKSESRIGSRAYLSPGAAFAGGTLARDITYLTQIGAANGQPSYLLNAARQSNDAHMNWERRKLLSIFGENLSGRVAAVWGLTYKAGTNTLRRSRAVELCRWLTQQGVQVRAHDPMIRGLPSELASVVSLCQTPLEAIADGNVLVVATSWREYQSILADDVVSRMHAPVVLDADHFLTNTLGSDERIHYYAVGSPA